MRQLLRSRALICLVGGAAAGPVSLVGALLLRAYHSGFGGTSGAEVALESVAVLAGGLFFGVLVALGAGLPTLVALALCGLGGVPTVSATGAVLSAASFVAFTGGTLSLSLAAFGALVGGVSGAVGALYERRSNMPFDRTDYSGRSL